MKLDIIYILVGTTRTGKIIPCASRQIDIWRIIQFFQDKEFSDDDFLDALALFEYLVLRAKRRKDPDSIFNAHVDDINDLLQEDDLIAAKIRANISSAFDLRNLGQSRARKEFADF